MVDCIRGAIFSFFFGDILLFLLLFLLLLHSSHFFNCVDFFSLVIYLSKSLDIRSGHLIGF